MTMWEAVESIPAEDIERGRTRVSADHELRRRFSDAWREATDGPKDEVRVSDPIPGERVSVREPGKRAPSTRPRRARLTAGDQNRKKFLAALRSPDQLVWVESKSGKARRQFWEGAESLLESLKDPATRDRELREMREDSEADEVKQAIGAEARAELEQIDELWGSSAPWNN